MNASLTLTMWIALALAQSSVPASQKASAPSPHQQPQQSVQTTGSNNVLQLQVMLDRAGFSPGPIDGRMGANTKKALELFQKSGNQGTPAVDAITRYRITAEDAAGPFIDRLPSDMMETAQLPAVGYTSLPEELAERFHSTPALLQQLNPGVTFAADEEIQVPNQQWRPRQRRATRREVRLLPAAARRSRRELQGRSRKRIRSLTSRSPWPKARRR
jgi:peptidoglycan hydrolase-like protein with peptidoglycan-binding domain